MRKGKDTTVPVVMGKSVPAAGRWPKHTKPRGTFKQAVMEALSNEWQRVDEVAREAGIGVTQALHVLRDQGTFGLAERKKAGRMWLYRRAGVPEPAAPPNPLDNPSSVSLFPPCALADCRGAPHRPSTRRFDGTSICDECYERLLNADERERRRLLSQHSKP